MKTLLMATLLVSFSALAAPIKTCSTKVPKMEESGSVPMKFEISAQGSRLQAKITQNMGEHSVVTLESVKVLDLKVRSGLDVNSDPEKLNQAENLIVHAMTLESDPVFAGKFKTGVNLQAVRSARVFIVGEETNMGSTSIVEAKDSKGKVLGSFLGGFLVSPCK